MPVAARLAQFIDTLEHRIPLDRETVLSQRMLTWFDYYKCLHILLKRHHECHAVYVEALRRHRKNHPATLPGQDRRRKAAQELRRSIETLGGELCRETLCFYVFARVVLDEIATAFFWYFALPFKRIEATHARLIQQFHTCCQERTLVCPDEAILPLMHDVHTRLAEQPATVQDAASHDLAHVLTCIEHYSIAMIEVFERNIEQSVFSSTLRDLTLSHLPSTDSHGYF